MTKPTAFGAAGDTLLAGGEAGAEAILPLKQFYDRLGDMLDKKLDAIMTGTTVYVYVTMDGEVVATDVYKRQLPRKQHSGILPLPASDLCVYGKAWMAAVERYDDARLVGRCERCV